MGVNWIRYFAILLIFAGLGIIVMGLQYHEALLEKVPTSAVVEEDVPSFVQSAWSLFAPNAKLSKSQAGIVSSGFLTITLGLVQLVLGPMLIRRVMERFEL